MLRVSRLLMKPPKAFEGGRTGAEPPKKTDPTAIPGGKAKTGGMVQGQILAQWVNLEADQAEDFLATKATDQE